MSKTREDDLGYIHRFVPGQKGNSLTLLLLHGTGGGEDDLIGLGKSLAPGAVLLSPRGNSLDEGMPRFFRRFGEGQFDEQDIIRRAGELAGFVSAAADRYSFDATNVVALGYSNGANIAAAVMLLHPDALAGGMLLRAMVPLEPAAKPDLSGKSVLMCSAKNDQIVPVANTVRLEQLLVESGASVSLHWTTSGHALTQDDLSACQSWLAKRSG